MIAMMEQHKSLTCEVDCGVHNAKGGFWRLSHSDLTAVLARTDLSWETARVYLALADLTFGHGKGQDRVSLGQIAEQAGMFIHSDGQRLPDRSHVARALKHLEKLGFYGCQVGKGKSIFRWVVFPPPTAADIGNSKILSTAADVGNSETSTTAAEPGNSEPPLTTANIGNSMPTTTAEGGNSKTPPTAAGVGSSVPATTADAGNSAAAKAGTHQDKKDEETTKQPPPTSPAAIIPACLDTVDFQKAWADWNAYRKQARKPLKPMTAQRQLDDLAKAGPQTAIAMIEQSIRNGWQGLFQVKDATNHQRQQKAGGFGGATAPSGRRFTQGQSVSCFDQRPARTPAQTSTTYGDMAQRFE